MKKILSALLLAPVLAVVAHAAAVHTATVTIYETVKVGANTLPAGDYKLQWADGAGVVDLSITGNKHNVTVPVTVTPRTATSTNVMVTGEGNNTVLQGFQVKTATLELQSAEAKSTK